MSRLDKIRARHERDEKNAQSEQQYDVGIIHRLLWRRDMAVPLWHQDRAYLLDLLDRIAALPEEWSKQNIMSIDCADELTQILNKD